MMDDYFFTNLDNNVLPQKLTDFLKNFSYDNRTNLYVLNKPLGEEKYSYSYTNGFFILMPGHKLLAVTLSADKEQEEFLDYIDEIAEDLGYISDKYEYKEILKRPRIWKKDYIETACVDNLYQNSFFESYKIHTPMDIKKVDLLISLFIGSINSIERIGSDAPEVLLDKIKRNIILFDADQTKFIFTNPFQKRITIQGLAGTGKTELLLHKLKDLYKKSGSKIVFTCHNEILATSLQKRIPDFFDFMKVDEQIKWNERLWVMRSWGSQSYRNSGLYSYICSYYNIPFRRYSWSTSFDFVCHEAITYLNNIENFEPCFDYILVDESQDFTENFFELCELVAKETVYISGDIFQNIFETYSIKDISPNYLLNKCYRTDPKTLMFAHALGMGLYETPKLNWLSKEEWEACGYNVSDSNNQIILTRNPIRRFSDDEISKSVCIYPLSDKSYVDEIIQIINEIQQDNPTVEPDDIAIAFSKKGRPVYDIANELDKEIYNKFGWDVNIGYETRTSKKGTLLISNKNNIKGLEFPFVICVVTGTITNDLQERNSLYMMLTRSFITSYLVVPPIKENENIIVIMKNIIHDVENECCIQITKPSLHEEKEIKRNIINRSNVRKTLEQLADEVLDGFGVLDEKKRSTLKGTVSQLCQDEYSKEKIVEIIETNIKFLQ